MRQSLEREVLTPRPGPMTDAGEVERHRAAAGEPAELPRPTQPGRTDEALALRRPGRKNEAALQETLDPRREVARSLAERVRETLVEELARLRAERAREQAPTSA